uniref:uncharacterized protein LOC122581815 isoform X2 n=1 Tax=Erigeron canadensis TaxID=72917 RepID=UPI001CB8CBD6|nr:uncharacterized protein LOC122581815 isoform X2 [Erigeron canadensis]
MKVGLRSYRTRLNLLWMSFWVPPSGVDSLIQVLGPEHPGRTRAVGSLVGLKKGLQGVGKKKRVKSNNEHSVEISSKSSVPDHKIDEPQCCQVSNVNVGSPEIKKSSSGPPQLDNMDPSQMSRCAMGIVFPIGSGLIHKRPLEDGHMRVYVDIVYSKYDALPLPVEDEVHGLRVLEDARHAYIQWPSKSIVLVENCQEDDHVTPDLSAHAIPSTQPLGMSTNANKRSSIIPQQWRPYAGIIKYKSRGVVEFFKCLISRWEAREGPIHIVAESGIFENQTYEFNIDLNDLVRLITERWIDVSIIAWFEIWLHSMVKSRPSKNQCAFMNAYSIQGKSCDLDEREVTDYIFRALNDNRDKKNFVAPYWQSEH